MRPKKKKRLRLINGKCFPGTETETEREADTDRQADRIEEKWLAIQNTLKFIYDWSNIWLYYCQHVLFIVTDCFMFYSHKWHSMWRVLISWSKYIYIINLNKRSTSLNVMLHYQPLEGRMFLFYQNEQDFSILTE